MNSSLWILSPALSGLKYKISLSQDSECRARGIVAIIARANFGAATNSNHKSYFKTLTFKNPKEDEIRYSLNYFPIAFTSKLHVLHPNFA